MKIYDADKRLADIVIVPREFRPLNDEALEIVSSEIEDAVKDAGLTFCGSLVLHTPFKDGLGCFIAAQPRRRGLVDLLVQKEDLYGVLFTELTEAELRMLYSLLYPRQEVDPDAVHAVLLAQADCLKKWAEEMTQ